jgi:hypothetical protein
MQLRKTIGAIRILIQKKIIYNRGIGIVFPLSALRLLITGVTNSYKAVRDVAIAKIAYRTKKLMCAHYSY